MLGLTQRLPLHRMEAFQSLNKSRDFCWSGKRGQWNPQTLNNLHVEVVYNGTLKRFTDCAGILRNKSAYQTKVRFTPASIIVWSTREGEVQSPETAQSV